MRLRLRSVVEPVDQNAISVSRSLAKLARERVCAKGVAKLTTLAKGECASDGAVELAEAKHPRARKISGSLI